MGGRFRPAHRGVRGAIRPLKVLDFTEFFSPRGGGVLTYLSAKARWFSGRPALAHVLVVPGPRDATREWLGSRLYELGGPPVPGSPGYHVLTGWVRLRRILEEERPDVIELGSTYLAPWFLRRALGPERTPIIGFFHSDLVGVALRTAGRALPPFARTALRGALSRYVRGAFRDCHVVVAPSDAAREAALAARLPAVRVVPFGVDLETFHPGRRDPSWKAEVGAATEQPVVLYVGRLGPEKHLGIVLDALPALHERHRLRLVTVGDGALRARLTAFAKAHPEALTMLPFEPDRARLARAYASADLLIAPCPHETFGMAAIEAAACGLRVATASDGAIGARLHGQPWARTFDATDPADLSRAVEELLGAASPTLREAARAAASGCSWDRTFSELLDLYHEAVAARTG